MRKTKEEANKTREEIIEAAAHLFETVGFEKTTMEEIARKAEVTRGAIYWHFKNKADVLKEFIDRENDRVAELVSEALGSDDSSFGKLKNMIFSVVDNFYDNRRFRQFIKITWA